jgi:toxin ParE1/3/4
VAQAKLIRSRVYRNALVREYQFIAQDNPNAAEMVVARIERATTRLREFPLSGPGWRIAGNRELVIPGLPYIVIYRVRGDAVELLALFHSSQGVPDVP